MLNRLAIPALLLLPSALLADEMHGTVVKFRRPTDKDDGILVVKLDTIGRGKDGKKQRVVYERSCVFARHLAQGGRLPGADKHYLASYPNVIGDIKEGDEVDVHYTLDDKKRPVAQGLRCYKKTKKDKEQKAKK